MATLAVYPEFCICCHFSVILLGLSGWLKHWKGDPFTPTNTVHMTWRLRCINDFWEIAPTTFILLFNHLTGLISIESFPVYSRKNRKHIPCLFRTSEISLCDNDLAVHSFSLSRYKWWKICLLSRWQRWQTNLINYFPAFMDTSLYDTQKKPKTTCHKLLFFDIFEPQPTSKTHLSQQ